MGDRDIRDAINIIAGTHLTEKVSAVDAIVESVDEDARTCVCVCVTGKAAYKLPNVRLMSAIDDGVLMIPAVDSTVSIVYSDFSQPYVSQFSEVVKVIFLGGDLGGLVKVIQLTDKLNAIEQKVNNIIEIFNTHVHSGVQTGGGSSAITVTPVTGTLVPTEREEIENKNITQG